MTVRTIKRGEPHPDWSILKNGAFIGFGVKPPVAWIEKQKARQELLKQEVDREQTKNVLERPRRKS